MAKDMRTQPTSRNSIPTAQNLDLGESRLWVLSYIDIEKVFIQNQTFKIGLGQTAPPKLTAMTIV